MSFSDFTESPTTVLPALIREVQIPSEVARPHQQNLDEDLKSEVPNIEEHTVQPLMPGSLVISPTTISPVTNLPLVHSKKGKGIKGGRKGYQYDVNVRALFSDPESTTINSYTPQILNIPTQPNLESITENYQQEIIQQTELPVQQTQNPIRETEPTTQRFIPTTESFEPIQETQSPIEPQVTQRPEIPTTTEYFNDQQTQLPEIIQSTQNPTTIRDEFARYPLGVQGRHLIKGVGGGKGKKGSKSVTKAPVVLIGHTSDPSQPLLPSLMG